MFQENGNKNFLDKNVLMAIVLSIAVIIFFNQYFAKPQDQAVQQNTQVVQQPIQNPQPINQQAADSKATDNNNLSKTGNTSIVNPANDNSPAVVEDLSNDLLSVSFNSKGAVVSNWTIKKYAGKNIGLNKSNLTGTGFDLVTTLNGATPFDLSTLNFTFKKVSDKELQASAVTPNFTITRSFVLNNYSINIKDSVTSSSLISSLNYKLAAMPYLDGKGAPSMVDSLTGAGSSSTITLDYYSDKKNNTHNADRLKEALNNNSLMRYISLSNRYFASALVFGDNEFNSMSAAQVDNNNVSIIVQKNVNAQNFTLDYKLYVGPKDLDILNSVDRTLNSIVDLGWFAVFAVPLLSILKWFYGFVHNFGVAIIFLTIFVKVVTFPLSYKSMKSMAKMKLLQPKMNEIKEKYKNDKERLNQETMNMMKTQGYNPVSGCLPMLIQLPIFIALYRVLWTSIELYQAPFFGWISDLSLKDPYYILPILVGVFMYLQTSLTPSTAADPMQEKMMKLMPVMMTVFMIALPSGLNVYIVTNSVFTIIQQLYFNKKFANMTV